MQPFDVSIAELRLFAVGRPLRLKSENPIMTKSSEPAADYDVGYGRPPKSTQFKKGQSGNPNGGRARKKKAPEDLGAVVRDVMSEFLPTASGGMSGTRGYVTALRNAALRGNTAAMRHLFTVIEKTNNLGLLHGLANDPVLVVPGMASSEEEWEKAVAPRQARHR